MPSKAPSWRRDLPRRQVLLLRGRWPKEPRLLPKSLSPSETLPGFEDTLLRRGTLPLLCHDRKR
jgi:hypothetical protein